MIISDDAKVIYFHIPRTAGTTIQANFRQKFQGAGYGHVLYEGFDRGLGFSRNHVTYLQARDSLLKDIDLSKYFKFTFVRNPYDRFYSAVQHLANFGVKKKPGVDSKYHNMAFKEIPINEFVQNVFAKCVNSGDYMHLLLNPMHPYVCDDKGNANVMDRTYKFENLHADFNAVCSELGYTQNIGVHRNIRDGAPMPDRKYKFIDLLDDESIKIINEAYHKDFELFKYEKVETSSQEMDTNYIPISTFDSYLS